MIKDKDLENRDAVSVSHDPKGSDPKGSEEALDAMRRAKRGEPGPQERTDARIAALGHMAEGRIAELEAELAALKAKIAETRNILPPKGVDDGRSWGMGRDSAVSAIENG